VLPLQYYQELKQWLSTNLEGLAMKSKIRYHANPTKSVKTFNSTSKDFISTNSDEMDVFIDLLINELLLHGLNPTGELEVSHK
jgi:hypothetical protein